MCERERRRSHVPLYSLLAELSHSEAALPGKIAWNLNLVVLFWDTHTLTHTAWPLAEEDTQLSSRFVARGEFIRRDLFLLSMFDSSRIVFSLFFFFSMFDLKLFTAEHTITLW